MGKKNISKRTKNALDARISSMAKKYGTNNTVYAMRKWIDSITKRSKLEIEIAEKKAELERLQKEKKRG